MPQERSVTVLISGRGSNLKSLIENREGYRVTSVLSNKADAGGLQIARENGIPTAVVPRDSFASLVEFKQGVLKAVRETKPDLVALAGFMVVLQPEFIKAFEGRLLNIHPSLLPQFPGLDTHARAVESKVRHHGCTVHFVDTGVDTGPLVAQGSVELSPSDDATVAGARVLAVEHVLYPWVLSKVAQGEITLNGRSVEYSERAVHEATLQGFSLFPS